MSDFEENVLNEEENMDENQEESQEELSEISSKAYNEFLFRDIDAECCCESDCDSRNVLEANAYENSKNYIIECLAAGVGKEDINVSYINDILTISIHKSKYKTFGKTKANADFENYERRFLVREIDFRKIRATLKNGILTISIPKRAFEGEPRKIRIS